MADSVCWVFVEERTGFGAAVLADAALYRTTSYFSRTRCPARDQAQLPDAAIRSQNFAARFHRSLWSPSTRSHRSARLLQCRGPNSSHWTVARSLDRWRRKPRLPGLSPTEHRCLQPLVQNPGAQMDGQHGVRRAAHHCQRQYHQPTKRALHVTNRHPLWRGKSHIEIDNQAPSVAHLRITASI